MKNKMNAHFIDAIVILILGISVLFLIPTQIKMYGEIDNALTSPSLFPKIVGWSLIILAIFRFLIIFVKREKRHLNIDPKNIIKFLINLFFIFLYVILIPYLGFFLSTMLTMIVLVYMLGKAKWYYVFLLSIITTIIVYFSFTELLHIPLPEGIFGF